MNLRSRQKRGSKPSHGNGLGRMAAHDSAAKLGSEGHEKHQPTTGQELGRAPVFARNHCPSEPVNYSASDIGISLAAETRTAGIKAHFFVANYLVRGVHKPANLVNAVVRVVSITSRGLGHYKIGTPLDYTPHTSPFSLPSPSLINKSSTIY